MIIIGIDPGTIRVGYGVILSKGNKLTHICNGAISAPRKEPVYKRLRIIFEGLAEVIKKHKPDVAAIEEPFVGKNIQTTIRIGEGRGAALVISALHDLEVVGFSPTAIKKAVTGKGGAHKSQVQAMVKILMNLPAIPEPDDAADALAMAIACAHLYAAQESCR